MYHLQVSPYISASLTMVSITTYRLADLFCSPRRRRIKCDERKPGCLRCEKFGCTCEGYKLQFQTVIMAVTKHGLIPKSSSATPTFSDRTAIGSGSQEAVDNVSRYTDYVLQNPASYIPAVSDQLTIYSPSTAIVRNEQEDKYFRFYKEVISNQLSGVRQLVETEWK